MPVLLGKKLLFITSTRKNIIKKDFYGEDELPIKAYITHQINFEIYEELKNEDFSLALFEIKVANSEEFFKR